MRRVTIERLESSDQGTFGRLLTDGLILFTGELPWRDNRSNVSCIPDGVYHAEFSYSPRFYRKMWMVHGVKNRTGVRIHSANFMGDVSRGWRAQLNGCIALGEKLGVMGGQKAVLVSVSAVRRFEQHMHGKPFLLEVKTNV